MNQFNDHNSEEADSVYTRPALDCYYVNKYWNFLVSDLKKDEIEDLKRAKQQLEHYEKLYTLMEYGADICETLTTLQTRLANQNPSIPMTVYRQVIF